MRRPTWPLAPRASSSTPSSRPRRWRRSSPRRAAVHWPPRWSSSIPAVPPPPSGRWRDHRTGVPFPPHLGKRTPVGRGLGTGVPFLPHSGKRTPVSGRQWGRAVSGEPPEYLGVGGRLEEPAGAELVSAGFAAEMADAPVLHRGFGLADVAHVLELADLGVLPADDAAALLGALLDMVEIPPERFPY